MIENEYQRKYYKDNKPLILKKVSYYQREVRAKLFKILGNKCIQCGFTNIKALQVDHKNGNGYREYKEAGNPQKMYKFYIKNPVLAKEKLQILCANCNWIKRHDKNEWRKAKQ